MSVIYSTSVHAYRYLAYQAGVEYLHNLLTDILQRDGESSLAGLLASEGVPLRGATYLTVPFDCPEGLQFESLQDGMFFFNPDGSQTDSREYDDIDTRQPAIAAISGLVVDCGYTAVSQLGTGGEASDTAMKQSLQLFGNDGDVYQRLNGVAYCVFSSSISRETVEACLYHPIWCVTAIARTPRTRLPGDQLLGWVAQNAQIICAQVFDYAGLLIWFANDVRLDSLRESS